jgi:hypothetical protein
MGINNNLKVQTVTDDEESNISSNKTNETGQVITIDNKIIYESLETLLRFLAVDQTNTIKNTGKNKANESVGICNKMKMLDTLYKDVLELSEKDGSLNWEKKGLGSSIEALRKEGFIIPAKKGVLPREERDALLRSLTQQRDDQSSKVLQLQNELYRCNMLHDDTYRNIIGHLNSLKESWSKMCRGVSSN